MQAVAPVAQRSAIACREGSNQASAAQACMLERCGYSPRAYSQQTCEGRKSTHAREDLRVADRQTDDTGTGMRPQGW
jgi:hypothetical protein